MAPERSILCRPSARFVGGAGSDRILRDVHLDTVGEQVLGGLVDAHVGLDAAQQDLVAARLLQLAGEPVCLYGAEADLLDRVDAVEVLGHLGHGAPQALGVLLGHERRESQHARSADEHRHVRRNLLEVEHGRAECLLHVHDHQRGARAVELHALPRACTPGSSASLIAKPRSR